MTFDEACYRHLLIRDKMMTSVQIFRHVMLFKTQLTAIVVPRHLKTMITQEVKTR